MRGHLALVLLGSLISRAVLGGDLGPVLLVSACATAPVREEAPPMPPSAARETRVCHAPEQLVRDLTVPWVVRTYVVGPCPDKDANAASASPAVRASSGAISLMLVCVAGTLSAAPREAIPGAYRQIASEYGLPAIVLYAAALTASGRILDDRGSRPWPWTLTFQGQRYHYPTRTAAHRALTALLVRGGAQVRVGVMALPWRRYAAELGGPWAALDPYTNLTCG